MKSDTPPSARWGPLLLVWGALALVFLPQALLLNAARPEPWPAWQVALRNAQIFLLWALFTPLVLAALRRWPPEAGLRARHGLRLAGVALLLVLLHLLVMAASTAWWLPAPVDLRRLLASTATGMGATNVLMALTVFAAGAAELHFSARRRAESQLVEARLAALRHQLQPHFLFNTLNALAELVHRDAARTESLLLRLSALLRRALDDAQSRRITLSEELAFLDDYLAIQQALLGERLRLVREVEGGATAARLPPMLLQPLVENALRHGIGPRPQGGELRIAARREGQRLVLAIEDDGVGFDPAHAEGVGLRNTRERLQAEYGSEARLTIGARRSGGGRVILEIPWQVE